MKTVYSLEHVQKSIFLAGPTPRLKTVESWRPEALQLLETQGFNGIVFVPERRGYVENWEVTEQVRWEWEALNCATVVLFWIPRNIQTMPGFTTNVEFGMFANSSKILMGYPPGSPKMDYLDLLAKRYSIPTFNSLEELSSATIKRVENPYKF